MQQESGHLNKNDMRRRFDCAAGKFDKADFVHRSAFSALLERLEPVSIAPEVVLDVGAATGTGSRELAKRYRGSQVIALDQSLPMLRQSKRKRAGIGQFFGRTRELQCDANQLPLRTDSTDLVVANLLLPFLDEPGSFLNEVARVLQPGGLFAFSALGPDSFRELRDAWRTVDDDWHVNPFPDMHNIGDVLLRTGLADPVLDVDRLIIRYRDTASLFRDLTNAGARSSLANRRHSLTGRARYQAMERALIAAAGDDGLTITLELVFGHAWVATPRARDGEFRVDPAAIGRRLR